jgi:hypothetical protein
MKRSRRHIMGRSIGRAAAVRRQEKSLRSEDRKKKIGSKQHGVATCKKKTLNLGSDTMLDK